MQINSISSLFPKNIESRPKLLTIYAHPDDEVINASGIMSKSIDEKIEVSICCLSKGEKGIFNSKYSKNIIKIRENELVKVAKELGAKNLFHYDIPDGQFVLYESLLKQKIIEVLEEVKPQCIITHDPSGITNHPDHIKLSETVFKLIKESYKDKVNLYFSTITKNEQLFGKQSKDKQINFQNLQKTTHKFDISNFITNKAKFYRIYESQNIDKNLNIPLEMWFSFNNFESLHKVDFEKNYKFDYYPFYTNTITELGTIHSELL